MIVLLALGIITIEFSIAMYYLIRKFVKEIDELFNANS